MCAQRTPDTKTSKETGADEKMAQKHNEGIQKSIKRYDPDITGINASSQGPTHLMIDFDHLIKLKHFVSYNSKVKLVLWSFHSVTHR